MTIISWTKEFPGGRGSQIQFIIPLQALDQAKRYEGLSNQCKSVSGPTDLGNFMRVLPLPPITSRVPRKAFAPPQIAPGTAAAAVGEGDDVPDFNVSNQWIVQRGRKEGFLVPQVL